MAAPALGGGATDFTVCAGARESPLARCDCGGPLCELLAHVFGGRDEGADGAGAAEGVTVVPGGNEGDLAVIAVTWGRETTALELTLPGDAELKLVDAF